MEISCQEAFAWRMYDSIARPDADLLLAVGRLCAQHVSGRQSAVLLSGCRSAAGSCS